MAQQREPWFKTGTRLEGITIPIQLPPKGGKQKKKKKKKEEIKKEKKTPLPEFSF